MIGGSELLLHIFRKFCGKNFEDLLPQGGHEFCRRVPYDRPIEAEVLVHNQVTKRDDLCPGNLNMPLAEFQRETRGGLADHGEFVKHRGAHRAIPHELVPRTTAEMKPYVVCRFDDVLKVK